MLIGIATVIYPSADLDADKAFRSSALGVAPVDGRELGLDPGAASEGLPYPVTYWSTSETEAAPDARAANGATTNRAIRDLGDGLLLATMKDTAGNFFGLLQRPEE